VPFPGAEGMPGRCACARGDDGCVRSAASRGRRKPGRAHAAVRGEGGGGLGLKSRMNSKLRKRFSGFKKDFRKILVEELIGEKISKIPRKL
jgi:hypothetical protein